jgi:predicted transcriptional regulator of viral defense system
MQTNFGKDRMAQTLEHWIDALQARGRYTFLRAEAIAGSGLSPEAVKKALQRLGRRHRLAKVKDYFYVIVPLEYLSAGSPPPSWFIHDLMTAMRLPYYVCLLSAAALHGSSHQQPQEFQVMTDRSVRPLNVGRSRIRFFVNKHVAATPVRSGFRHRKPRRWTWCASPKPPANWTMSPP